MSWLKKGKDEGYMLVRVYRSGEIEGDYFINLSETEQKNLQEYIARKEKEQEKIRQEIQRMQKEGIPPIIIVKPQKKKSRSSQLGKDKTVYSEEEKRILLEKIIALRMEGENWRNISQKLKIPLSTALKWYKGA